MKLLEVCVHIVLQILTVPASIQSKARVSFLISHLRGHSATQHRGGALYRPVRIQLNEIVIFLVAYRPVR